jgi:hypothetical protein
VVSSAAALINPARTSVFISYRRQDTAAAAEHLHASLGQYLGPERIFRDVATIEPGENFPDVIEQAIRASSVVLALIGPRWLEIVGPKGRPRLEDPKDYVRLELESALHNKVTVIPVLVDGATMPTGGKLPAALANLEKQNAYSLPWHEGVVRLQARIVKIERERTEREAAELAERARLDLTRGQGIKPASWRTNTASASINTVIRAMERSLQLQGHSVVLDPEDFFASLKKFGVHGEEGAFLFPDMISVIDLKGVKARRSRKRYVARSYPLHSLDELPKQLGLDRPVLAGVKVFEAWFKKPILKTGFVDVTTSAFIGAVVGVVLAWDPANEQLKLLTPWPTWGNRGMGTLTRKAAEQSISAEDLRSIEAVEIPLNSRQTG